MDKITSFLSLFGGQKLQIATLVDFATGQKKVDPMLRNKLFRDGHVFTADAYVGQEEADVEDIIGREAYIAMVNGCYGLKDNDALPEVTPPDAPMRCLKEAELKGDGFDHFRLCEFLTRKRLDYKLPGLEIALDRFEKLFKDMNALLPSQ